MGKIRNKRKKALASVALVGTEADSVSSGQSAASGAAKAGAGGTLQKALLTLLVVGGLGAMAGLGTFSAFSATTTNSGNNVSSGTVKIDQHTGATTLYSATNKGPGQTVQGCVRVTYSGSITASAVKLYVSSGITNGSNYNLEIDRGSGLTTLDGTMSCAGFTQSSVAYNGALGSLGTTYAAGVDGKASAATWLPHLHVGSTKLAPIWRISLPQAV
jgi:hypothetical protein